MTDAEILALAESHSIKGQGKEVFGRMDIIAFGRAILATAAPIAGQESMTVQTLAGFKVNFVNQHGRAPSGEELWAGGVQAGMDFERIFSAIRR